jgi:hypothetical protein
MNPRVTGMKPWEAVTDLSDEDEYEVVDLTAKTYKEGNTMATKKAKATERPTVTVAVKGKTRELDLSALNDDEFQALLDLAAGDEDTPDVGDTADDEVVDVTDELDDADPEDEDDEDADDEDSEDDDESADEDDEDDGDAANLSAVPDHVAVSKRTSSKKGKRGKSAKGKGTTKPETATVNLSLADKLAQSEWRRERRELVRAGVPPHMLDLAEPVLQRPENVMVDLSNDESIDASEVIRGLLTAAKGYIEVKPEIGHAVDLSMEDAGDNDPSANLLKAWDQEYGTV